MKTIEYTSDDSGPFSDKSIVSKNYVDNAINTAITGETAQYWTSGSTGAFSIKANNDTPIDATGSYSYAEGSGTLSSGEASHAEGSGTLSSGPYSHAEGLLAQSSGIASHAQGNTTVAKGNVSHAEGETARADNYASHAEGKGTFSSYFHPVADVFTDTQLIIRNNYTSLFEVGQKVVTLSNNNIQDFGNNLLSIGLQDYFLDFDWEQNARNLFDGEIKVINQVSVGDSRLVVAGSFSGGLAIVNTDGTLDMSFSIGSGFDGPVNTFCVFNSVIYVGGQFTSYNGSPANNILALNLDGTIAYSFGTGYDNRVNYIKYNESTNELLVAPNFAAYSGGSPSWLDVMQPDGTFVQSLNFNSGVNVIDIDYNLGVIYFGGDFTDYDSNSVGRIVATDYSYVYQPSFVQGTGFDNSVLVITVDPGPNQLFVGGTFSSYDSLASIRFIHLNSNGSYAGDYPADIGFNGAVNAISINLGNSLVYVGGSFTEFSGNSANRFAALQSDGQISPSFLVGQGFDDVVNSLFFDGSNVTAGGDFNYLDVTKTFKIARLTGSNTPNTLLTFDTGSYLSNFPSFIIAAANNREASHAEGCYAIASGSYSHAEGYNTKAFGNISHAEGYITTSSGERSHAEGNQTTASGIDSHAEGLQTLASGEGSHAEGFYSVASGYGSHAGGYSTVAGGYASFSTGVSNVANNDYAAAIGGANNQVYGLGSVAAGGSQNIITNTASNSVILGGDSITADTANTTYVPFLNIGSINSSTGDVLGRDPLTGRVIILPGAGPYSALTYVTQAQANTLVNNSGLTEGVFYCITDATQGISPTYGSGQVIVQALNNYTLSTDGVWLRPTNLTSWSRNQVSFINSADTITSVIIFGNEQLTAPVPYNTTQLDTLIDIAANINANPLADVKATVVENYTPDDRNYIIFEDKIARTSTNGTYAAFYSTLGTTVFNNYQFEQGRNPRIVEYQVSYEVASDKIRRVYDPLNNFTIEENNYTFTNEFIYSFRYEDESAGNQFPFRNCKFVNCIFTDIYFTGSQFEGTTFKEVNFQTVLFNNCNFFHNTIDASTIYQSFFDGSDFIINDLNTFNFESSYISTTEFNYNKLTQGFIRYSLLSNVNVDYNDTNIWIINNGTEIISSTIRESKFNTFTINESSINSLYLTFSDISASYFELSQITNSNITAKMSSLNIQENSTVNGLTISSCDGSNLNIYSSTVANLNISNCFIQGLSIASANVQYTDMAYSTFMQVNLDDSTVYQTNFSYSYFNLFNANLSNLNTVNFSKSNVSHYDNFAGKTLDNIDIRMAIAENDISATITKTITGAAGAGQFGSDIYLFPIPSSFISTSALMDITVTSVGNQYIEFGILGVNPTAYFNQAITNGSSSHTVINSTGIIFPKTSGDRWIVSTPDTDDLTSGVILFNIKGIMGI